MSEHRLNCQESYAHRVFTKTRDYVDIFARFPTSEVSDAVRQYVPLDPFTLVFRTVTDGVTLCCERTGHYRTINWSFTKSHNWSTCVRQIRKKRKRSYLRMSLTLSHHMLSHRKSADDDVLVERTGLNWMMRFYNHIWRIWRWLGRINHNVRDQRFVVGRRRSESRFWWRCIDFRGFRA